MVVEKDFPKPPGGKLTCDDGQTAIIKIKKGVVTASCSTPPSGVTMLKGGDYSDAFKKWVVAIVKGKEFRSLDPLRHDEEVIFEAREYQFFDSDGVKVRVEFVLPTPEQKPEGGGRLMEM